MSYDMTSILLIGSLRSPPLSGLRRTSPRESVSHDSQVAFLPYESCSLATPSGGGQNKTLYAFLQRHGSMAKHPWSHRSAGGRWCRKAPKGLHFLARKGSCMVLYKLAPKAPYLASAAVLYNSRGRKPSTRPGGVSRSRTEPWQPRAKGPAAGSTLTPVRVCQPSGILSSTA